MKRRGGSPTGIKKKEFTKSEATEEGFRRRRVMMGKSKKKPTYVRHYIAVGKGELLARKTRQLESRAVLIAREKQVIKAEVKKKTSGAEGL